MSLQISKCVIILLSVHSALGLFLRGAGEESPSSLETAEDQLDKIALMIKEGGSTTNAPNALVAPSLGSSTLSISDLLASAKWPASGSYDQAFSSVMTGAAADSCAAPLLARSRLSPWGMGAHLNQFANEVELAIYSGKPIALCAPDGVRDAWGIYFENPGFSKCGQCDWRVGPRQYPEMGWDVSDSSDHAKMADVKRFLYKKLFTLKPDAKMAVDEGLQKLGLSGSYIGVHVRRGDKSQEVPLVPLERFTAAIQDMHSTLGTSTVFLATDDASVKSALQQQLGSSYEIVEQKRLPDEAYQLRGDASRSMVPPFGEEEEEKSVLTDVAALAGAAGFIGTASSNIDRLVYFQRDSSLPSVSLDEGGLEGFITLSR